MSDHRPHDGGAAAARRTTPTFNVTPQQALLLQNCIEKQQDFIHRLDLAQHPAFHDDVETLKRWRIELQQIKFGETVPAEIERMDREALFDNPPTPAAGADMPRTLPPELYHPALQGPLGLPVMFTSTEFEQQMGVRERWLKANTFRRGTIFAVEKGRDGDQVWVLDDETKQLIALEYYGFMVAPPSEV